MIKKYSSSNLHIVLSISNRIVLNTIVQILTQLKQQTASAHSERKWKAIL